MYSAENIKQFPSVLIYDDFEYDLNDKNIKILALTDGLEGWALALSGSFSPDNFGYGMLKISKILDGAMTFTELMKIAKEISR